jgi:electron transfer flavoprotein beta subunit
MKHVVDTTEVRIDKNSGELILSGIPTKISDYDKNAIEEAVRIKEKNGGEITLITVGPRDAFKTVKEALAMGCDVGYIILGDMLYDIAKFLDPITIAEILSKAIQKLGSFDLIFCGEVSEDGYNAQVGPALAELLGLPHAAYASSLEVEDNLIKVESMYEDTIETFEIQLPAVVTVNRLINTPRLPTLIQVMKVPKNKIIYWDLDELDLSVEEIKNSKIYTSLKEYHEMKVERKSIIFEGEAEDAVSKLIKRLKEEGLL